MTRANDYPNNTQQRTRIASAAARLIAEDGISDYALAKRKAAHSLGLPENTHLPENSEVDSELRIYQRLFQDEEQLVRITYLRQKAAEIMTIMQRFNPYLTGPVLDGTAGRYAEIDIQLFTDSAKDVEIFLLNQRIGFEHSTPRSERAEAVLTIHDEDAVANLIIYLPHEERINFKTRDGRTRQRARLDTVNKLLIATRTDTP
ncbi:hypothetical protein [Propionivibrio sp.]|uniref:hypothetical protein n=1 Tax=Propionivibrio sp. TaxID=2212460 RepID=UPI003BF101BD